MMKHSIFLPCFLCTCSLMFSCGDDDFVPEQPQGGNVTTKVSKPTISIVTHATTDADFKVVFKVKSKEQPSVSFKYGKYYSKPSNPTVSQTRSCRLTKQDKETYYYTVEATGFSGGTYIYYQCFASNSAGSVNTNMTYTIIKR